MKAWLVLEDVPVETGPFAYVKGSHRLTPQRLAWEKQRSLGARDGDCRLSARGSPRIDVSELTGLGLPHPRSEEHTSELQSLMRLSYAVFCLKKKNHRKHPRGHDETASTTETDS